MARYTQLTEGERNQKRPASVMFRTEIGHWEIETIFGKGLRGAAVTIVDRASRYALVRSVKRRTADEVTWATISLLTPFALSVRSITADNGKEFAWRELIAGLLEADFYFATPYRSWERGTNENTNGLIRQYLPKSAILSDLTAENDRLVMERLNNRPRKVIGFRTLSALFAMRSGIRLRDN